MDQSPSLEDVLDNAVEQRLASFWTSVVGIVQSYDSSTRSVSVQPVAPVGFVNQGGDRMTARMPVIQHVPVVFPGGAGGEFVFDISPGDQCLLVMTSHYLGLWAATGQESDPQDDRRNHLGDCLAFVGARPLQGTGSKSGAPSGAAVLRGNDVNLGDTGGNAVLTTADGNQFLQALEYAISQSSGNLPGLAALTALYSALTNGGTPGTPSAPAAWPTGASKVKAV